MNGRPRVAITDYLSDSEVEGPILADVADVETLGATDERTVLERAPGAEVLLVYHDIQLSRWAMERLTRCKGIVRCGVGFDNIDLEAAGRRGIVVCNVPDYGTEEVADHALMLLLACCRRLLTVDRAIRENVWDPTLAFGTPRLRGKTLGLIGCGRIGSAMARRGLALGMRVVFHDPYKPDGHDKALGIERVHRLEELLAQSQFVSIHTPATTETTRILDRRTLALLPEGAYVINTARGACIDLDALHEALESGRVAWAGLDVMDKEPLEHEPIRRHPRVVLSPHSAWHSTEGFLEMRSKGAQEAKRILTVQPVRNPVNLHVLTQPRCAIPSQRYDEVLGTCIR